MNIGLINREEIHALSPALEDALDSIIQGISTTWQQQHDDQGAHTDITCASVDVVPTNPSGMTPSAVNPSSGAVMDINAGIHFGAGPVTFDDVGNNNGETIVRPPLIASSQDNYAPAGIDTALGLDLESSGAINITGIRAFQLQRRLLIITNIGNSNITLKHNTTSVASYRFGFPGGADIVLASTECIILFYNVKAQLWYAVQT